MKIHTDLDSIQRSIHQDIASARDAYVKVAESIKEPEDSLEISRENTVASKVRLENAAAASELLKEIQAQIANHPQAALLAQANIVASNVTGLVG